ncbi:ABC transporter substrate-binding protein [Nocardiopsis sp. MG754419]|uniref:ABC transporter substrate-binding protein n=1 Tax=Nocardiopsis sp. MG754419 TaxID=2259865 RepID=UPI001BAB2580|nr:ABC transporter substrate-binding protein [Nocardiopsis sp. MG754419]MBR8744912.1 glycine/betaine ABC transporter substrate-binding protein [Nocardiopsis sp. MG754419]
MKHRIALIGIPLAAALLTACGGSDPFEEQQDGGGDEGGDGTVVVGSADFPESALLAEIYGRALEAEGASVDYQLNIGSREVYYDQIEAGSLSLFPEYNGGILFYLDPEATIGDAEETNAAITDALPDGLEILDSSEAENKDSVTVTRDTAEEADLTTIADLAEVAEDMTLGAPAEFETRPQGVPGLESVYGVEFGEFRSLDPALITQALSEDDIQAGNLFTTDPLIAVEDFVVLEDPENLFGAQNITPLINSEQVDADAREAINAVSAALTTEELVLLNERIMVDNDNAADVAQEWLEEQGLA